MKNTQKNKLNFATLILLLTAAFHYFLYMLLIPPWEGHDEPMHYEYVELIKAGYDPSFSPMTSSKWWKSIPDSEVNDIQEKIIDSMRYYHFWVINELPIPCQSKSFRSIYRGATALHQAPLYYYICSIPVKFLASESVINGMYICRFVSLLFWLGAVYMTLIMSRALFGLSSYISYLPPLLMILLPMPSVNAAVVNNDALAIFLFSTIIAIMVYSFTRGVRLSDFIWLGLMTVLALYTKRTTFSLIALIMVFALLSFMKERELLKLIKILTILIPIILLGTLLLMSVYTDQYGINMPEDTKINHGTFWQQFLDIANQKTFIYYFFRSFWGSFVWGHHFMEDPEYLIILVILIVIVVGMMWRGIDLELKNRNSCTTTLRIVLLFIFSILLQFGLVYLRFFSQIPMWNIAQGRFIFVVLGPIFALIILGLTFFLNSRHHLKMVIISSIIVVLFDLYVQIRYIIPHFYMYYY